MTARLLAGGFALLALAGCGGGGGEEAPAASALRAMSRPPAPREAAKPVSRSLWAVVPTAPKRKQDVRPELIRGSAVAVADDTLLTSCRVLGKRKQVGLIRHNKYRMAQLASADPRREVCVLRMADGPLNVAAGYRDPADLRPGEPIYALVNRTAADVALAQGQVVEVAGRAEAPRLRTSLVLPADVQSGVLIDEYGNLVGVAGPQPGTAGGVAAAVVTGRLAPRLASLDAPTPTVPVPVAAPRVLPAAVTAPPPVLVLRLDDDEDSERPSVRDGGGTGGRGPGRLHGRRRRAVERFHWRPELGRARWQRRRERQRRTGWSRQRQRRGRKRRGRRYRHRGDRPGRHRYRRDRDGRWWRRWRDAG